eukprot:TRINITY_DN2826_c0_g1_i7.p1 TRINITY_DN2826_c0_g1~~TRINITY_DN2826_c0_g1_i7.p1  ORF type:complete len:542 (+),score=110.63 TRINITY_DN2826_c0_g1_i7:245-1870(+)
MIACVSPSLFSIEETINTLNYACRANKIKTRLCRQREGDISELSSYWQEKVLSLQRQVKQLKRRVADPRNGSQMLNSSAGLDNEQDKQLLCEEPDLFFTTKNHDRFLDLIKSGETNKITLQMEAESCKMMISKPNPCFPEEEKFIRLLSEFQYNLNTAETDGGAKAKEAKAELSMYFHDLMLGRYIYQHNLLTMKLNELSLKDELFRRNLKVFEMMPDTISVSKRDHISQSVDKAAPKSPKNPRSSGRTRMNPLKSEKDALMNRTFNMTNTLNFEAKGRDSSLSKTQDLRGRSKPRTEFNSGVKHLPGASKSPFRKPQNNNGGRTSSRRSHLRNSSRVGDEKKKIEKPPGKTKRFESDVFPGRKVSLGQSQHLKQQSHQHKPYIATIELFLPRSESGPSSVVNTQREPLVEEPAPRNEERQVLIERLNIISPHSTLPNSPKELLEVLQPSSSLSVNIPENGGKKTGKSTSQANAISNLSKITPFQEFWTNLRQKANKENQDISAGNIMYETKKRPTRMMTPISRLSPVSYTHLTLPTIYSV